VIQFETVKITTPGYMIADFGFQIADFRIIFSWSG